MYNARHCSALCSGLFKLISENLAGETAHLGLNWVNFSVNVDILAQNSHIETSVVDRDNMMKRIMEFLIHILERTSEIRHPRDEITSWKKLGCREGMVRVWLRELGSMVSMEMYTSLYKRFPTYLETPYDDGCVQ